MHFFLLILQNPNLSSCVIGVDDADDVFRAGEAVVLTDEVPLPRNKNDIFFDGGDKILSSKPISVVRGGFPETATDNTPGPLMAGTVEVAEVSTWGTNFVRTVWLENGTKLTMLAKTHFLFLPERRLFLSEKT